MVMRLSIIKLRQFTHNEKISRSVAHRLGRLVSERIKYMQVHTQNKTIWQSYVWHEGKCFFVSTIERNFDTCEGTMRGMETLVWQYNFEAKEREEIIYQAGGVHDHQNVCRCLIALGVVPDENDERTARFLS